jgi:hypothetical protein
MKHRYKNRYKPHIGKTNKNKHIHNNATCNLTQNGHLSW